MRSLDTDETARLLGAATNTKVHNTLKVWRDHGITPAKCRGKGNRGGGGRYRFTVAQVLGILLYHVLGKTGLDADCRAAVMMHVAGLGDEQLEARLADGKHYLMKTGSRCVPELWPLSHAELIQRERGEWMRQLGLTMEIIDVRPFAEQLIAAASKLIAATADEGAEQC